MIYVQYDGPLGRRRGSASEGQQSGEGGSEAQGDEGQVEEYTLARKAWYEPQWEITN